MRLLYVRRFEKELKMMFFPKVAVFLQWHVYFYDISLLEIYSRRFMSGPITRINEGLLVWSV